MAMITLRISHDLLARIRSQAARHRMPIATWIKQFLGDALDGREERSIDRGLARIERLIAAIFALEELAVRQLDPKIKDQVMHEVGRLAVDRAEGIVYRNKP